MQQVYDFYVREDIPVRVLIGHVDPLTTAVVVVWPDSKFQRMVSGGFAHRNPKDTHNLIVASRLAVKRALKIETETVHPDSEGRFESVDDIVTKLRYRFGRELYSAFRNAQREQKKVEELPLESYEILGMLRKQVSEAALLIPVAGTIAQRIRILEASHNDQVAKLVGLLKKIEPQLRLLSSQADAAGNGSLVIGISDLLIELRALTGNE